MKPAVVKYKDTLYLHYANTAKNTAKLLNTDGTKFAGTPSLEKLTILKEFDTKWHNDHEYFMTKQGVFSCSTGNKITQQEILDLWKPKAVTISVQSAGIKQSIDGEYHRLIVTFSNGIRSLVYNECSPAILLYNLSQLNSNFPKNEFWKRIPADTKPTTKIWLRMLPKQWQDELEPFIH